MRIRKNPVKIAKEIIDGFQDIAAATIFEAGKSTVAVDSKIKPLHKSMKLCGRAVTVQTAPKDNLTIHEAVTVCQPGDILVIDVEGYTEAGYWGEILTLAAINQGIAGIIINGGVRDAEEIEQLGFPVFCLNLCIVGTNKSHLGTINYPINLNGTFIRPGDIIVGDRDGVVVVPHEEAKETLEDSRQRMQKEKQITEELKTKTTMQIYSFDKIVRRLEEENNDK